jgi:hypothetical protein
MVLERVIYVGLLGNFRVSLITESNITDAQAYLTTHNIKHMHQIWTWNK